MKFINPTYSFIKKHALKNKPFPVSILLKIPILEITGSFSKTGGLILYVYAQIVPILL